LGEEKENQGKGGRNTVPARKGENGQNGSKWGEHSQTDSKRNERIIIEHVFLAACGSKGGKEAQKNTTLTTERKPRVDDVQTRKKKKKKEVKRTLRPPSRLGGHKDDNT